MNNQEHKPDLGQIVFIEDNMHDAELIRLSFKQLPFRGELIRYESGHDFLRNLKSHNLDRILFLILDMEMPRMTGVQIMQRLAEEDLLHFPVVFFSASRDMKSIQEAQNLGANAYIIKPFDFDEFQKVVKDIWRLFGELHVSSRAMKRVTV